MSPEEQRTKQLQLEQRRNAWAAKRDHHLKVAAQWRAENRERLRDYFRQYRAAYRDKVKENGRRWYADNRKRPRAAARILTPEEKAQRAELARQRARKWRDDNRERKLAADREYQLAHPEKKREHGRAYRERNEERLRDDARERSRKARADNPERFRANQRKWKAAHPDEVRAANANRRVSKIPAPGTHTAADILDLFERQAGRCAGCGTAITKSGAAKYHIDHIIPLKPRNGRPAGTNDPSNLQLLCKPCNLSKSNLDHQEWLNRRKR